MKVPKRYERRISERAEPAYHGGIRSRRFLSATKPNGRVHSQEQRQTQHGSKRQPRRSWRRCKELENRSPRGDCNSCSGGIQQRSLLRLSEWRRDANISFLRSGRFGVTQQCYPTGRFLSVAALHFVTNARSFSRASSTSAERSI